MGKDRSGPDFKSETPGEKRPGVSSVSEPVKKDRFLTGGKLFSA